MRNKNWRGIAAVAVALMMGTGITTVATLTTGTAFAQSATPSDFAELPDAQPGECFAKVLIPAAYEEFQEEVVTREASFKIDIAPAKYETVTEEVVVKPAYKKLVPVPAKMKTVTEAVVVAEGGKVWRVGKASKATIAKDLAVASARAEGLPADAEAGACYTRFFAPASFEEKPQEIVVREKASKFAVTPAAYEWVEEQVLIRPVTQKIVEVPAEYETVTEKVLVRPAYVTWKKGRGAIERVDNGTGEIMCRVEVPAEYKEIKRRVLKSKATTEKIEVPAKYETVKVQKLRADWQQAQSEISEEKKGYTTRVKTSDPIIGWRPVGTTGPGKDTGLVLCRSELAARTKKIARQVVAVPATVNTLEVPAKTKLVKVRKIVTAAVETKTEIPAETKLVARRKKLSDERLAWRPVLCETNASNDLVAKLQRALKTEGHNPGPIDGRIGRETLAAVDSYQRSKNLARGGLTKATLDSLGVALKTN